MGLAIDESKNGVRGQLADISKEGTSAKVLVIPTNEELMIALDTERLLK